MTIAVWNRQEIAFNDEGSFAELLQTFGTRIPVLDVRPQFPSGRASDGSLQTRLAESRPGFLMPRGPGSIEIDVDACGSLSDTATGALSATWLHTQLSDGLGGGNLAQVGGVAGATASVSALTNGTGTRVRGTVLRVGQKGDGRADGQPAVTDNPTTSLLTSLPGAPNAGDVVRACLMQYPAETLGATKRFLVGWNSTLAAGSQFAFHGCQLAGLAMKIAHGQLTTLTLKYDFAHWRELSGFTVPSGTTLQDCKAAVAAGGSYNLNDVGNATRAIEAASQIALTVNLGLADQSDQRGVTQLQRVTGWVRSGFSCQLTLTVPPASANQTDYDSDGSDSPRKHFLAALSVGGGAAASEGRHFGFYLPNMYPSGPRPTVMQWNGLVYQEKTYTAVEGPDTTNDLTRSAVRFFQS